MAPLIVRDTAAQFLFPDVPVSVSARKNADADEGGTTSHHRNKARAGRDRTGARYRSADEPQEDDDEIDGDDLKPHFESPPWLGPLEAFDLGGGDSINPSINRYLREFQREGVRDESWGGGGESTRVRRELAYSSAVSDYAVEHFRRKYLISSLCGRCAVLWCAALWCAVLHRSVTTSAALLCCATVALTRCDTMRAWRAHYSLSLS